ncbi:hypothetical protein HY990_01830 [Candidatus Micrarchaeota archaeon]|nr:hypothetical protein [Candidatus Micrarchaeota archaeon]
MVYTIRNIPPKTREIINSYSKEYDLNVGDAVAQLIEFGWLYYEQNKKAKKKYANTLDALKNLG